jgi:hypothetical protein
VASRSGDVLQARDARVAPVTLDRGAAPDSMAFEPDRPAPASAAATPRILAYTVAAEEGFRLSGYSSVGFQAGGGSRLEQRRPGWANR